MAKSAFQVKFDPRGVLAKLAAIPRAAHDAAHVACREGARMVRDEMQRLAPVNDAGHIPGTKDAANYVPGVLKRSIYMAYSKDNSGPQRVVFDVGPNVTKAKHWYLVEHGHWLTQYGRMRLKVPKWIPGRPYIRPAWDAKGAAATAHIRARMFQLLAQNLKRGPVTTEGDL
jgi:hypothetical protein